MIAEEPATAEVKAAPIPWLDIQGQEFMSCELNNEIKQKEDNTCLDVKFLGSVWSKFFQLGELHSWSWEKAFIWSLFQYFYFRLMD